MSIGWVIFIVVFVLGIIISNILLLKQSANMKLPDSVVKAIEEKKAMERLEEEQQNTNPKKPD
jgi:hypothetical protein